MSHPDPTRDYEVDQQAQDEEQAFLRCVELVQMAQQGKWFSRRDIKDLIYHLGVKEHFK